MTGIPRLSDDEVHLWLTTLGHGQLEVLSSDESNRAERFIRHEDRRRFVAARSWMRTVVAGYVDLEPSRIRFTYGPVGKPELQNYGLSFNLAHSQDFALLGISASGPIGVDIEVVRPDVFSREAAALVLSSNELAAVEDATDTDTAFLTAWVRKEAYVKAFGTGLERSLSAVTLGEAPFEIDGLIVEDLNRSDRVVGAAAIPAGSRLIWVREYVRT
mgnify:CR=1 FL=1